MTNPGTSSAPLQFTHRGILPPRHYPPRYYTPWLHFTHRGILPTAAVPSAAAIAVTVDHKPNNKDERERIENAGGVVIWAGTWRVGGVLAVSRAFGDKPLKPVRAPVWTKQSGSSCDKVRQF